MLISPQPDQEGNKLQRPNFNFCKPLKKNSEGCPSNQVSVAAMTSALDEKWRLFTCFFQSGQAKDLSAPLYCCTPVLIVVRPVELWFLSVHTIKNRDDLRTFFRCFESCHLCVTFPCQDECDLWKHRDSVYHITDVRP